MEYGNVGILGRGEGVVEFAKIRFVISLFRGSGVVAGFAKIRSAGQRNKRSVVGGQWSEVSGRRSEVRGQRSEVSGQRSVGSGQWAVGSWDWGIGGLEYWNVGILEIGGGVAVRQWAVGSEQLVVRCDPWQQRTKNKKPSLLHHPTIPSPHYPIPLRPLCLLWLKFAEFGGQRSVAGTPNLSPNLSEKFGGRCDHWKRSTKNRSTIPTRPTTWRPTTPAAERPVFQSI